jgi:hypothetical protein
VSSLHSARMARIVALAQALGASLGFGDRGGYYPDDHRVVGLAGALDDTPEGQCRYAVWLHELGHAAGRYHSSASAYWHNPLPEECGAWAWAIDHADQWSEAMQGEMVLRLGEYLDRYPVESHCRMVEYVIYYGQGRMVGL